MAVRAALVVALQLLLKTYLHAGAQVLGECPPNPGPRLWRSGSLSSVMKGKLSHAAGKRSSFHRPGCDVILHFH